MRYLTSDDFQRDDEATQSLTLPTGEPILIRPLGPHDRSRLSGLFARMSLDSRRRRFLSPKRELSDRDLRFFTDIDHLRHEALAAIDVKDGSFIGVARYVQFRDRPRVGDVAVEVADQHQSMGVATALMSRLVERGRANGLQYFSATTRWENGPARALARRCGFRARSSRGGELVLEMALG